jgi:hypothetical protein
MSESLFAASEIFESFKKAQEEIRKQEVIVVVHPDDLTDEMRRLIEATPLTALRESRFATPGKLFVIRPGLLLDDA